MEYLWVPISSVDVTIMIPSTDGSILFKSPTFIDLDVLLNFHLQYKFPVLLLTIMDVILVTDDKSSI